METIKADVITERLETELENELLPGVSALGSDVAALAGELDFRVDEINYICSKTSPFKFLLDQWCKRDRKKATLNQLAGSLKEIRRPDLAEKVETFMSSINKATYLELQEIVNIQDQRLKRREEDDSFFAESLDQEPAEESPLVYAMYFAEDELYENEVETFVTDLRLEYSIDVRTNLSSKEYAMNKQVFVFDSLMKADYVLIFCSPAFKVAEEHKVAKRPQPSERHNELMFCLHYIIKEIYRNKSVNRKYIPITMKEQYRETPILKALLSPKRYHMPGDKDQLVRRLLSVEDCVLPTVQRQKEFKPRKFIPR